MQQAVRPITPVETIYKIHLYERLLTDPSFNSLYQVFPKHINNCFNVKLSFVDQYTVVKDLTILFSQQTPDLATYAPIYKIPSKTLALKYLIATLFQDGEMRWQKIFQVLDFIQSCILSDVQNVILIDLFCYYSEIVSVSDGRTIENWILAVGVNSMSSMITGRNGMNDEIGLQADDLKKAQILKIWDRCERAQQAKQMVPPQCKGQSGELQPASSKTFETVTLSISPETNIIDDPVYTSTPYFLHSCSSQLSYSASSSSTIPSMFATPFPARLAEQENTKPDNCRCGALKPNNGTLYVVCRKCARMVCVELGCTEVAARKGKSFSQINSHLIKKHYNSRFVAQKVASTINYCPCGVKKERAAGADTNQCHNCKRHQCLRGQCTYTCNRISSLARHKFKCLYRVSPSRDRCSQCHTPKKRGDDYYSRCPLCRMYWCLLGDCIFECTNSYTIKVHRTTKHA